MSVQLLWALLAGVILVLHFLTEFSHHLQDKFADPPKSIHSKDIPAYLRGLVRCYATVAFAAVSLPFITALAAGFSLFGETGTSRQSSSTQPAFNTAWSVFVASPNSNPSISAELTGTPPSPDSGERPTAQRLAVLTVAAFYFGANLLAYWFVAPATFRKPTPRQLLVSLLPIRPKWTRAGKFRRYVVVMERYRQQQERAYRQARSNELPMTPSP